MKTLTIAEFKNLNNGKISNAWIKKLIEKGIISVWQKDMNNDLPYNKIEDVTRFIKDFYMYSFNFKYYQDNAELEGYTGTSFYYKFTLN